LLLVLPSCKAQTKTNPIESLVGYWFIPHNAGINISFFSDSTFVFNDYNTKLQKDEILEGTFQLKANQLILIYSDRPKQTFNLFKYASSDDDYYIKKGNYYFVKADPKDIREDKAMETLRKFYTLYILECSKTDGNSDSIASFKNKYLTKNLQKKLKDLDLDYDPILNAQDCDESSIVTLNIKQEEGQKNVYDVCYTWLSDDTKICIKLLLMENNGNYLIDNILSDINLQKNFQ